MADISSMMDEMLQQMRDYRTANPPPQPGERQGALQALQQAQLTAGKDNRPGWQVLLESRLLSPNLGNAELTGYTAFKALDDWKKTQREMEFKRQVLAANAQYEDVLKRTDDAQKGMGGSGVMTQMAHAVLNPIMNIGGFGVDRLTGKTIVPKEYLDKYTSLYNANLDYAKSKNMPAAEQWADQMAQYQLMQQLKNPSIAGPSFPQREGQAPLPSQGGAPTPQQMQLPQEVPLQQPVERTPGTTPQQLSVPSTGAGPENAGFSLDVSKVPPEVQAALLGQIAAYRANPNPNSRARLEQTIAQALANGHIAAPEASGTSYPRPPASPALDVPAKEMEKATGEVQGKDLGAEYKQLRDASSNSGKMVNQLQVLKNIYENPNIPQGEYGPMIQGVRSGLASFGFKMDDSVGEADLADKIAKNWSLHLRTADGINLLPGAMSNYEDKLLQGMGPGLGSTRAGRRAQVDMMIESSIANQRIYDEANKLAAANRGILPHTWNQRRELIMKQEMARLAIINREILAKLKRGDYGR